MGFTQAFSSPATLFLSPYKIRSETHPKAVKKFVYLDSVASHSEQQPGIQSNVHRNVSQRGLHNNLDEARVFNGNPRKCTHANSVFDPLYAVSLNPGSTSWGNKIQSRIFCQVSLSEPVPGSSTDVEGDLEGTSKDDPVVEDVIKQAETLHPPPAPVSKDAVPAEAVGGKAGFVSFSWRAEEASDMELPSDVSVILRNRSLLWLVGPLTLVASSVLPPIFLRKAFEALLEDNLVTDFLILFFTEVYFYIGAASFLVIAQEFRRPLGVSSSQAERPVAQYTWGYKAASMICSGLSIILPVACFYMIWPFTGPAVAAALIPYMLGLAVQLVFEKTVENKPSIRPLVPIVFQVYRLHQLSRAAQLVAGLMYSMKGVETTAQTMAISGALQMLLTVLQVLGMLCLWSLSAFLVQTSTAWQYGKGFSLFPM